MKSNENGFSAIEGLVVILAVLLIGAAGWFVWQAQPDDTNNQAQNNTANTATYADCQTEMDKTKTIAGSTIAHYEWKTIDNKNVLFPEWDIAITLPDEMVGEAVCRYSANGYILSTKSVVEDETCVQYFRNQELTPEGLIIWRLSRTEEAATQVGSDQEGTLNDYYNANKAEDVDYFSVDGRAYYKIGDNFYVTEGGVVDDNKDARTIACANEQPNYGQTFVDAMATIREV